MSKSDSILGLIPGQLYRPLEGLCLRIVGLPKHLRAKEDFFGPAINIESTELRNLEANEDRTFLVLEELESNRQPNAVSRPCYKCLFSDGSIWLIHVNTSRNDLSPYMSLDQKYYASYVNHFERVEPEEK